MRMTDNRCATEVKRMATKIAEVRANGGSGGKINKKQYKVNYHHGKRWSMLRKALHITVIDDIKKKTIKVYGSLNEVLPK